MNIQTLKTYLMGLVSNLEVPTGEEETETKTFGQNVYGYPATNVEFPCANVTLQRAISEWHSQRKTQVTTSFKVQFQFSVNQLQNQDEIDSNLMELIDEFFGTVLTDRKAGGNAMYQEAKGYDMGWLDQGHTIRYADIIVEYMTLEEAS